MKLLTVRRTLFVATIALAGCARPSGSSMPTTTTRVTELGAFTLTNDRNPLTNRVTPSAATFDDERNGMLQFSCGERGLDVVIGVSGPVAGLANTLTVRVVFDSAAPSPASAWLVQRQGNFTLAYLRPDLAPVFAASSLGATESRVEVHNPINTQVVVYRFSLKGLAEARKGLPCWQTL